MEELVFKIFKKGNITEVIACEFIELLKKQGKVNPPDIKKMQSCKQIVLCYADVLLVGIGALKVQSESVFDSEKSNLEILANKFQWELGYFYVLDNCRGLGISSTIAKILLKETVTENIMASTELYKGNPMEIVLRKNGFAQYGSPWNSAIHNGTLGLFLKFAEGKRQ